MTTHFERDLDSLEQELLSVSSDVQGIITKSCRALREGRPVGAKAILQLEDEINRREVKIEEECLKILALHQPVAIDLRRIAAVMKINAELERIADLSVNVLERAQSLAEFPDFHIPLTLDKMAQIATSMVQQSLHAFVSLSTHSARDVLERDDEVDALNVQLIEELRADMRQNPDIVEPALHFFSAARQIERIADHATNIAEDVVYLVDGEIARHGSAFRDSGPQVS